MNFHQRLQKQKFANGYELIDGIAMHADHGDRFQIPHDVLKQHVSVGHFVELRIDSKRFVGHDDASEKCMCELCHEHTTKPVISHDHPASLVSIPDQKVPSRGWGEDFWVRVEDREASYFRGNIDNPLYEAKLHELHQGDSIYFHSNHILAVHPIHRQELVSLMNADELKELCRWLATQK